MHLVAVLIYLGASLLDYDVPPNCFLKYTVHNSKADCRTCCQKFVQREMMVRLLLCMDYILSVRTGWLQRCGFFLSSPQICFI